MTYRQFKEAKQFVHNLGLRSRNQWLQYCRSGEKPNDIPTYPEDSIYKKEWKGWGDWLGTGTLSYQITGWSIDKVKELLNSLIKSKIIYQWNEAVLYSFLLRKGVLNLRENRHEKFFNNLIDASPTKEGCKAIEDHNFCHATLLYG